MKFAPRFLDRRVQHPSHSVSPRLHCTVKLYRGVCTLTESFGFYTCTLRLHNWKYPMLLTFQKTNISFEESVSLEKGFRSYGVRFTHSLQDLQALQVSPLHPRQVTKRLGLVNWEKPQSSLGASSTSAIGSFCRLTISFPTIIH